MRLPDNVRCVSRSSNTTRPKIAPPSPRKPPSPADIWWEVFSHDEQFVACRIALYNAACGMAPSKATVALRRNGRQQSCERCRKLKIRCDHAMPICGRCLEKGLGCVYATAPMTRRFRSARFDADSGRLRTTSLAAPDQDDPAPVASPTMCVPPA